MTEVQIEFGPLDKFGLGDEIQDPAPLPKNIYHERDPETMESYDDAVLSLLCKMYWVPFLATISSCSGHINPMHSGQYSARNGHLLFEIKPTTESQGFMYQLKALIDNYNSKFISATVVPHESHRNCWIVHFQYNCKELFPSSDIPEIEKNINSLLKKIESLVLEYVDTQESDYRHREEIIRTHEATRKLVCYATGIVYRK